MSNLFFPKTSSLSASDTSLRKIDYPLLPMEKGLLFHSLSSSNNASSYLSQGEYRFDNIDPQLFCKAWQQATQHFEVLRSCFRENHTGTVQQIVNPHSICPMHLVNLEVLPYAQAENAYQKILRQELQTPINFNEPPLMRLVLCHMPQQKYRFVWTYHHLLCDLRSALYIFDQVMNCYQASLLYQVKILPPSTTKAEVLAKLPPVIATQAKAYWHALLKDYEPTNELPLVGNTPHFTTESSEHTFSITCAQYSALKQFTYKHRLTPSLAIHTAWGLTICSYLNRDDIVFGSIRSLPYSLIKNSAGLFINNLPVRIRYDHETTVLECLYEVRKQHKQLKRYWNTALGDIQFWLDLPAEKTLLNSCVSFSTQESNELIKKHFDNEFQQLQIKFRSNTHYPLLLEVFAQKNDLLVRLTSSQGLFSQEMLERLGHQLVCILQQLINHPEQKICQLAWLGSKDSQQLTIWNQTNVPFPESTIKSLLEKQVHQTPQQIAVQFEDKQLTYFEFNTQANQIAHWLREQGIKVNTPVLVYMDQCIELPLALLAIIKAMGVYLPVDVRTPRDRLHEILKDSQTPIVLTTSKWENKFIEIMGFSSSPPNIFFLDEKDLYNNYPKTNLPNSNQFNHDTYLIYTSGSTGKPKGVINHNRGLVNRLNWMKNYLSIQPTDRVLQKTSISFDVSMWEFLLPWLVGASTVLTSSETLYDFGRLIETINTQQITILHFIPTVLSAFLQSEGADTCQSIRHVISSGEALNTKTADQCMAIWPHAKLHNLYGPTEASIDVSFQLYKGNNNQLHVPIGKPIDNIQLFVLNSYQQPVPIGGRGELYIGGIGVAKGYLNQPELTAKCFIRNPLKTLGNLTLSEILYKTGDIVAWTASGELSFIGRIDNQIKWHGFRIELDEIKTQLLKHPDISECVLQLQEINRKPQIIAYYVTKNSSLTSQCLEQALSKKLPYYMVPHHFLRLNHLPLLTNGKLNRKALPLPTLSQNEPLIAVAKADSRITTVLLKIWKEVLQTNDVTTDDNLFSLGGDSINIIQIITKARQHEIFIKPKWVFKNPTIAKLTDYIKNWTPAEEPKFSVLVDEKGIYLTPIQHWFFEKAGSSPNSWHQYLLLTLDHTTNVNVLLEALDITFSLHDVFRLRFKQDYKGHWHPFIIDKMEYAFESIDLTVMKKQSEQRIINEILHRQAKLINIVEGPLVRICLIERGKNRKKQLLLIIHHLIIDVISWHILIENIVTLYKELHSKKSTLSNNIKNITWKTWTQYLNQYIKSKSFNNDLQFWVNQQFHIEPIPLDYPLEGPILIKTESQITHTLEQIFQDDLLKITEIPIELLLIFALGETLADWKKSPEIFLDIEHHGRNGDFNTLDLSHTVGWFTNIFPFYFIQNNNKVFENLITLKKQWDKIKSHSLNYEFLYYLTKNLQEQSTQPKLLELKNSEILFNYLGSLNSISKENDLFQLEGKNFFGQLRDGNINSPYVFEIQMFLLNKKLHILWIYNSALHSQETIANLIKKFEEYLVTVVKSVIKKQSSQELSEIAQLPLTTRSYCIEKIYPLSPTQRGILFHSLSQNSHLSYMTQLALTLSGHFKIDLFREVWEEALMNIDLLRTAFFTKKNGEAIQIIFKKLPLPIQLIDLRNEKKLTKIKKLNRHLKKDRLTPFVMDIPPLFRLALIMLEENKYLFIYTCHHIISDGWSVSLLFNHILHRYYEKLTHAQMTSTSLYLPYSDYTDWIERQSQRSAQTYWQALLHEFESPIQLDIDKNYKKSTQPFRFLRKKMSFGKSLSQKIKAITREQQITLNVFIQSAWAILLSHYSHQQKIVFGSVISGRSIELEHIESRYGLFAKVIPTVISLQKFNTIIPLCQFLLKQHAESEHYSHYPLSHIQNDIYQGQPLFNTIVAFENYPLGSCAQLPIDFKIEKLEVYETTHYPLNVFFFPNENDIEVEFVYDTCCFDPKEISQFSLHFKNLLEAIVADINQPLHCYSILTKNEQKKILMLSNHFVQIKSSQQTLNNLIAVQAKKHPNKIAIQYQTMAVTYEQLIQHIDLFSAHLYSYGVKPGDVVGLIFKHHPDALIAMLACLKLGCTYLPISPDSSLEYIEFLIKDSNVQWVLTHHYTSHLINQHEQIANKPVLLTDHFYREDPKESYFTASTTPAIAYIMYTSGSTGKPKGISIRESAIIDLLYSINQTFNFTGNDAFVASSSFIFDISVVELYLPLLMGGVCIILPSNEVRFDSLLKQTRTFANYVFIQATPSIWSHWIDFDFPGGSSIKIISTGEALPTSLANRLIQKNESIWNCYGPTETTIFATTNTISHHTDTNEYPIASIGKPLATVRTYILDEHLSLTPIGITGELYISGTGVMQGYIGETGKQLNEQKLIPNPFKPKELLYKTGDKVCWLPDGNLQFLGRFDDQVKIRGLRMDLNQIACVLEIHSWVRKAIILKQDKSIDTTMIAYLLLEDENILSDLPIELIHGNQWATIYDRLYQQNASHTTFDTIGWTSSYTGKPFSKADMEEWAQQTVHQIVDLSAQKILEIGCGMGLLLFLLTPQCLSYHGIDISTAALAHINKQLTDHPFKSKVSLSEGSAHSFQLPDNTHFDTIVINSTVQYFPHIDYLMTVLDHCLSLVADGGQIWIGDVRNLTHLKYFHATATFYRSLPTVLLGELKCQYSKAIHREKELLVDPVFFIEYARHCTRISHVDIRVKTGQCHNEMNDYRYDVILHIAKKSIEQSQSSQVMRLNWRQDHLTLDTLAFYLQSLPSIIHLTHIPHTRWVHANRVVRSFEQGEEKLMLSDYNELAIIEDEHAILPAELKQEAIIRNYEIFCMFSAEENVDSFDAILRLRSPHTPPYLGQMISHSEISSPINWQSYANKPWKVSCYKNICDILRQHLIEKLPHYMTPSSWVLINEIPTTANGKLDKKALALHESIVTTDYQAAHSEIEQKLIHIWQDTLGINDIGTQDNFFQLGGHSLNALHIIQEVAKHWHVALDVTRLFEAPTILQLAQEIQERLSQIKPERESSSLVTLSTIGQKPPLFLIHPVGGTVFCYIPLVESLVIDHPVVGIQDPQISTPDLTLNSLPEMATYYIQLIKMKQSTGPYYLAGASLGGTLAIEISHQLSMQGETVNFLGLFDTWAAFTKEFNSRERLEKALWRQYHFLKERLKDHDIANPKSWLDLNYQRLQMLLQYPHPSIQTPIHLFKAQELESEYQDLNEPSNHWSQYAKQPIKIYPVPGNHESLLIEPNVKTLAKLLTECLEKIDNNCS